MSFFKEQHSMLESLCKTVDTELDNFAARLGVERPHRFYYLGMMPGGVFRWPKKPTYSDIIDLATELSRRADALKSA